jgi:hypothetical protein
MQLILAAKRAECRPGAFGMQVSTLKDRLNNYKNGKDLPF